MPLCSPKSLARGRGSPGVRRCRGPLLAVPRLLGGRLHVAALALRPPHREVVAVDPRHGVPDVLGDLGEHLGVVEMRGCLNDGSGALLWLCGLEYAAAHEDALHAHLHAQRGVRRRSDAARREVDDGQLAVLLHLLQELDGGADLLGVGVELVLVHHLDGPDLLVQGADVEDGRVHVAGAGLSLRADHAATLGDAPQRLAQVPAPAHEGHLELVLVDVVVVVRDREDLALVDAVDAELLEHLGLHEVADAALGHHWYRDGVDDLLDHLRVGHARHSLLGADVGGDALQRHHGAGAGCLGDLGLLRIHHVHDDAALQHRGQALLHALGALDDAAASLRGHCCGSVFASAVGI
mmetsp:Transcript_14531/g.41327  ORF Transcript_14531/g.41327 Transcript_14531/m.41327 type:complete len:351 (-) Transcript_14531:25-1077(-)